MAPSEANTKAGVAARPVIAQGSFFDRTFVRLANLWRDLSDTVTGTGTVDSSLSADGDIRRLGDQMRACLDGRGGEVSARGRAAALGQTYLGLDKLGRERFLRLLAGAFDVDRKQIDSAVQAILDERYPGDLATDYSVGDFRGVVRVSIPADRVEAAGG